MAKKERGSIYKIVVSDPKTGKAVQIDYKGDFFLGKKIGDKVPGDVIGLNGYELEIKGGSGFEGAPMVDFIEGPTKKYVWWKDKKERYKKLVRGNTISPEIVQINTVVVKYGEKPFEEIYNEFKAKKQQSS